MTTSYRDGISAVDRLLREAEQIRRVTDPEKLERDGFPGYPLMRPQELPEYLRHLRFWMDEHKREAEKAEQPVYGKIR